MKRVAVIGGGASGLMAAYAAAKNCNEVTLFEKNEKTGKKIYITGKGRCNVTNDCAPDEFLQNVVHGEKFLRGAVWAFSPADLMELLRSFGLELKVERGNRVFPLSDHASDVTKTLEKACRSVGVSFRLQENIEKIDVLHSTVSGIVSEKGRFPCDAAIVATGGLAYPSTGSTGDGYQFAREAGHTVTPLFPSLTGIELKEDVSSLQGISLKNVVLTAKRGGKTLFSELGEMLFTHYGISGPLVLTLSALVARIPLREISLSVDLKPALDEKKLDERLLRDLKERCNEQIKNVMRGLLPAGACGAVLKRAGVAPEKRANSLTKEERGSLISALKGFPLTPAFLRGFSEAVVTSGGVDLKEIDPKTMESEKVKGLYFCGEVLDADAFTGGFNLQIAFSTGYAAGKSIR